MSKPVTLSLVFIICLSNVFAQDWIQKGSDIDGEASGIHFGETLSMSPDGKTIAIGALDKGGNGIISSYVRVFSWSGSAWTQKGSDIVGEAEGDQFGSAVSLNWDGNSIVIGAPFNDGTGLETGYAQVFSWRDSVWTQQGSDIVGEAAGDGFGKGVSISSDGNNIAIGAPFNDGIGPNAGHVRLITWSGSDWTQKGSDIDGKVKGSYFGESVSLSGDGNSVAIGAPDEDGNGSDAGCVRLFSWSDSAWTQKGLDIDGKGVWDRFGSSVSISLDGNSVAIGAPFHDGNASNAGHVRVFTWMGLAWTQKGTDIGGETAWDRFGSSVSLSSHGNSVAIGAPDNDRNGSNAGRVRLFAWTGKDWALKGLDIVGEAAYDHFGSSVSMSPDGNSVAIGAPENDGNGLETGHVRVFRYGSPDGISPKVVGSTIVYPNPSSNNFTLKLDQNYQVTELKVMDAVGQLVSTKKVESASEVDFEITGKQGVYFVEISTSDGLLTAVKVIKE